MNTVLNMLFVKMQDLMKREEGQDLVEYGLVISIVAVGIAAVLPALKTSIVDVFSAIETSL